MIHSFEFLLGILLALNSDVSADPKKLSEHVADRGNDMTCQVTDSKPLACVVLPTYNEVENIGKIIPQIFAVAHKIRSHTLIVLVVDDNSPDGTAQKVQALHHQYENLHLISGKKKGLGDAYTRGIEHAIDRFNPDLIIQMDADGQHDPTNIPLFIELAQWGFNLVIGSRFAPGGETPDFSLWRKFLSHSGNWLIRFLGGIPRIHDCTSGYRCVKVALLKKCRFDFLSTRGYSFQSSLVCELLRNKAKVIEVPIVFRSRWYGISKLSIRDQLEFLLNVAKIRFQKSEEFIKFCFVGFSGILVNIGIYILLTRLLSLDVLLASPVAIEISILNNFYLNHLWTFRNRTNHAAWWSKLVKFHLVAGVAGVANYITFVFLIMNLGVFDIIANLVGIFSGTLINYALNSFWTWREIGQSY